MISNHVSARQNLTGHLGCSVDEIDTLGGKTGQSWWQLGVVFRFWDAQEEPPATMKIV